MKPNLLHFQKLNQENIQERIKQRRLSVPDHQPTPPPPPQEPQQAEATLDLRLSLGYNQPTSPPSQPQQADEIAPSSPPKDTNQTHATSESYPHSQELYSQERVVSLPLRTTRMESFYSSSSEQQHHHEGQNEDQLVNLSLGVPTFRPNDDTKSVLASPGVRRRRLRALTPRPGKSETIPAPYPWATTRRAIVHSLNHLLSQGINTITGEVHCEECEKQYEIAYNLQEKFMEVAAFVSKNKGGMHNRAPDQWMSPVLPDCEICKRSYCVRPIIGKKGSINWLFLLLGQMLGFCKKPQLKYFCKHTMNPRTGTKDQLLYLTYLGLCKQLDPDGSFDP